MNILELQKRLLAAARRNPPGDQVPLAFEKRIMARLTANPPALSPYGVWLAWSRSLWLGAAACTAIALITCLSVPTAPEDSGSGTSFSEGVEQYMMAFTDDLDNAW
jgi:hypothetical protein